MIENDFRSSDRVKGVPYVEKPKLTAQAQLVHSLAPVLTLTKSLNHLANMPQQTSILFGLMYPTTAQHTINMFTTDYNYLCFIHFRTFFSSGLISEQLGLVVSVSM